MTFDRLTKNEQIALLVALGNGSLQHFSSTPLVLEGTTLTGAQIDDRCKALAALIQKVNDTREAYETALLGAAAHAAETKAFVKALVPVVQAAYGDSATVLGDFGLTPRKPPTTPKVATKAAAVAKRLSTREARHTAGPKARLAVHGDVTGVTITPVEAPPPAGAEAARPAVEGATAKTPTGA